MRLPIKLLTVMGGGASTPTQHPLSGYTPLFDLDSRFIDADNRYLPTLGGTAPTKNLIGLNSGKIINESLTGNTATEYYATGPQGGMTAKRLQINATTGIYDFIRAATGIPAGPYTFKFKIKSNAGQGTANFQYGVSTGGGGSLASGSCDESGWTTISFAVAPNGTTDAPRISIKNVTGSLIDVLIDEVQFYYDEDTIPPFADELTNVVALKPRVAFKGSIPRSGQAIDSSGGAFKGIIPLDTYPLTKAMTEVTIMAMISTEDAVIVAADVLSFDSTGAGPQIGMDVGNVFGIPPFARSLTNKSHRYAGLGYHVVTVRAKANEQSLWLDKFKHTVKTVASPTIPSIPVMFMANDEAAIDHAFKGKFTRAAGFDRWLTDSEVVTAVDAMMSSHAASGEAVSEVADILIVEGDSIFANVETAPNGPGWMAQYFATLPTGILGMNNAVAGSNLGHLTTRLTSTTLTGRIQTAVANGYNVIVPVQIGANAIPTIAALQTYWSALRTAGAKVIACTILPQDDGTFNTNRATRNTDIRGASAYYDALVDFDTDSDIGQDANPPLRTHYFDDKHLNAAGHTVVLGLMQTAIDSLRV